MTPVVAPAGLLAVAITVWAAATGQWVAGAILGVCLEAARLARSRWAFESREFERITDLTTIALLVFLGWQWVSTRNAGDAVMSTLAWAPAFLAPLMSMQRFSVSGVVPLAALFWSLRKRAARGDPTGAVAIDYPYLCLCLLAAACGAPAAGTWFLPAVMTVTAIALFHERPRPRAVWPWGLAMAGAVCIALALQVGLVAMQQQVEAWVLDYLRVRLSGRHDASRTQTAIGDIGTLKLSDRILFRVETATPGGLRLRDGVFDTFSYDTWFSRGTSVRKGRPDGEFGWQLSGDIPLTRVRIAAWLSRGQAVLPLPANAVRLDDLNVGQVDVDGYGTVRVRQGADLVRFQAGIADAGVHVSQPPGPADFAVPPRLAPVLDAFLAEARGGADGARAVADAVTAHLRDRFRYTTQLSSRPGTRRTLEAFLRTDRAGHCEYFATAAALVLRRAGIPTRYVTGYVADEWSALERAYVVRARHGHAWTLAWLDGRWRELDATPPDWFAAEELAQPSSRGVLDVFSWLQFRWAAWSTDGESDGRPSLWWLVIILPLGAWVAAGVMRRSRRSVASPAIVGREEGASTPIAVLLDAMTRAGRERPAAMSASRFLETVTMPDPALGRRLAELARRYRGWRFDPVSREEGDRAALEQEARSIAAHMVRTKGATGADRD